MSITRIPNINPSNLVPSAKDYGAVGDGTTDDTAAITAFFTAISGKAGYFPAGTYMCNNLGTIPASTKIYGYGATLKKNANGDLASLAQGVEINGLTIHGNGGASQDNRTGKGFVITAGNDQKLYNVNIIYCKDRCLAINKDVGIRFNWIGGEVFRSDAITDIPILLGANGTPQESNGDRVFSDLFTGGNWLIDVQFSQTTVISNCDFINMNFHTSASKTLVSGCRIATLGSDVTVDGTQCNLSGNIIAGGITIASGASNNVLNNNTLEVSANITDNSGNATNLYTCTHTYTPTWASTGTQPAIGNGTIKAEEVISQDGTVMVTFLITHGSGTTFGTGDYTYSLRTACVANTYVYVGSCIAFNGAGNVSYTGFPFVVTGGSTMAIRVPSGTLANWGQTTPFAWDSGSGFRATIIYKRVA